jgi:hypothetical protein
MIRQPMPKKPVDLLRDMAAPRELVEWVNKMPPADAPRTAWIDATRAEWLPYIAGLRSFNHAAVICATCACLVDLAGPSDDPTQQRLVAILQQGAEKGRPALASAETDLEDLRLKMIAHGDAENPPAWTLWAKIVFELARASRRGNPLIGAAQALKMYVEARGRRASADVIARFRDKITLSGS